MQNGDSINVKLAVCAGDAKQNVKRIESWVFVDSLTINPYHTKIVVFAP